MKNFSDIVVEMALEEPKKKREGVMANLTPAAKEMFDTWIEETGMKKTEAVARILEWLLSQSKETRADIIARKFHPAPAFPIAQVEGLDLATLSKLMRAVTARFDALMAEANRPALRQLGFVESKESGRHRGGK